MNIEDLRNYALNLGEVEECLPFGPDTLVFKAGSKVFLLLPLDTEDVRFNVKCNPEQAIEWREQYPSAVLPGYHMNKKHWNTIVCNGVLKNTQVLEMIKHSYDLVCGKASKKSKLKS